MKKKFVLNFLVITFYILTISCQKSDFEKVYNPSVQSQDFTGWSSVSNNASWTISEDGRDASQSVHTFNNPIILVSNNSYSEVLIEGTFLATRDDDNVGMVFGLKSPLTVGEADHDFYLYDWRGVDQAYSGDVGYEGHALSRVNGSFSGSGEMIDYFWARTDTGSSGKFDVLETHYGDGRGWDTNTTHAFKIYYTSSRIKVIIDGSTIFDVSGSYQAGRVGLYLFSQNDVTFSSLTLTTGFDPNSF